MSLVLVDTAVWRHYFSGRGAPHVARALDMLLDEDGAVLIHPAVVGELILGGLSIGEERLLQRLPHAPEVSSAELLEFIRGRKLARRGIGWVDCQLLASAILGAATLWSLDRKLAEAAAKLKVAFAPDELG